MRCPKCEVEHNQMKDGFTNAGSQRYRCGKCSPRYAPVKKPHEYPQEIRTLAIRMYTDGLNFRQVDRDLQDSHTTVLEWVKEHAEASVPHEAYTVEMDEL